MAEKTFFILSFLVFSLATATSCSSGNGGGEGSDGGSLTSQRYFQSVSNVTVEVHYEPGAEPYEGNTGTGRPVWRLLADNLQAIFQYRSAPPTLTYPTALGQIGSVPSQSRSSWTRDEILALHRQFSSPDSSSATAKFYVYFLNGYFNNGGGPQASVLGVSLGGTPVIAMFKDVIESSSGVPMVRKFVEQSTLIHEMGHALGFVNNGVPMVSPHQDTAHGAHTTNSDCVMYWANEGASDLAAFVQRYLSSGSTVMWGPEVLADAQALSR